MTYGSVEHRGVANAAGRSLPGSVELRNYYFVRAAVAAAWVVAAFTVGKASLAATALLIAYPAWDAVANLFDISRNGGAARNFPQTLNVAVSGLTAVTVALVSANMNDVLGVFGGWAILAGLMQLATGVRRWRSFGAQWTMILSGAQSALAGAFFISRSFGSGVPSIRDVAGYAAFGAFYFAVSALWLLFRRKA
jgi:uncharacterized membrane protein HdeD (DUF308 family)